MAENLNKNKLTSLEQQQRMEGSKVNVLEEKDTSDTEDSGVFISFGGSKIKPSVSPRNSTITCDSAVSLSSNSSKGVPYSFRVFSPRNKKGSEEESAESEESAEARGSTRSGCLEQIAKSLLFQRDKKNNQQQN